MKRDIWHSSKPGMQYRVLSLVSQWEEPVYMCDEGADNTGQYKHQAGHSVIQKGSLFHPQSFSPVQFILTITNIPHNKKVASCRSISLT